MNSKRASVEEYLRGVDEITAQMGKRRSAVIEGHIRRCDRWERELEDWALSDNDCEVMPTPFNAMEISTIRLALFARLTRAA